MQKSLYINLTIIYDLKLLYNKILDVKYWFVKCKKNRDLRNIKEIKLFILNKSFIIYYKRCI